MRDIVVTRQFFEVSGLQDHFFRHIDPKCLSSKLPSNRDFPVSLIRFDDNCDDLELTAMFQVNFLLSYSWN